MSLKCLRGRTGSRGPRGADGDGQGAKGSPGPRGNTGPRGSPGRGCSRPPLWFNTPSITYPIPQNYEKCPTITSPVTVPPAYANHPWHWFVYYIKLTPSSVENTAKDLKNLSAICAALA